MSIMKSVSQLAKRQSNYRVSDYIRKLRKHRGIIATRRQIMFCINRLQRQGKVFYNRSGSLIKTFIIEEL